MVIEKKSRRPNEATHLVHDERSAEQPFSSPPTRAHGRPAGSRAAC